MIVLSTDYGCERDFSRLARSHDLDFDLYVNRIHFNNPMTPGSLRSVVNELAAAADDILPGDELDGIVFCCTSASALLGDEPVTRAINRGKGNTPVLSTARASVLHIQQAGHQKVSLLAPYGVEVSRGLAGYFEAAGLEIVALNYMAIDDDREVASLSAESIIASAKSAQLSGADALFVSCTGMRAAEILPELVQATGLPVYSSNDCSFWQSMRLLKLL